MQEEAGKKETREETLQEEEILQEEESVVEDIVEA